MNQRHYAIARQIAERMRGREDITPRAVAREFGIGNNHAYMIFERAREIHLQWQMGHFRGAVARVAA